MAPATAPARVMQVRHIETGLWATLRPCHYLNCLDQPIGQPFAYRVVLPSWMPATFLKPFDVHEAEAEGRIRHVVPSTAEEAEADLLAHLDGGIGREAAARLRRRLYERGLPYGEHRAAAERAGAVGVAARHFRALPKAVAVKLFEEA